MNLTFAQKLAIIFKSEKQQYIVLAIATGIMSIAITIIAFTEFIGFLLFLIMPLSFWAISLYKSWQLLKEVIVELRLELKYPFMYNRFIKEDEYE